MSAPALPSASPQPFTLSAGRGWGWAGLLALGFVSEPPEDSPTARNRGQHPAGRRPRGSRCCPMRPPAPPPAPQSAAVSASQMREGLLFRCVCSTCLSCVRLCGPEVCSPPGSSVHGDFQARILEWVAMPSSRGSSRPRDPTCVSYVSCIGRRVPLVRPGKPTRSGILARTVLSPVCAQLLS